MSSASNTGVLDEITAVSTNLRSIVLALFGSLIACDEFRYDLDRPIALVPDDTLEPTDREALAIAGRVWNLAFGIPFVDANATTDQRVNVTVADFACVTFDLEAGYKGATFSPGLDGSIAMCPTKTLIERRNASFGHDLDDEYSPVNQPFNVLAHELGHASGIFEEGAGTGVMGLGGTMAISKTYGLPVFSGEDRALLFDAVGERTGSCSDGVVRMYRTENFGIEARCDRCAFDPFEPNDVDPAELVAGDFDIEICSPTSKQDLDRFVATESLRVTVTATGCGNLAVAGARTYELLHPEVPSVSLHLDPGEPLTVDFSSNAYCPPVNSPRYHLEVVPD